MREKMAESLTHDLAVEPSVRPVTDLKTVEKRYSHVRGK